MMAAVLATLFAGSATSRADGELPSELANVCIYHPEPSFWAEARRGMHGVGVFQLIINPKNGEVSEVKVVRRTGFQQLDASCVLTLFTWKFKPNTITSAKVPMGFHLRGYSKEIHR